MKLVNKIYLKQFDLEEKIFNKNIINIIYIKFFNNIIYLIISKIDIIIFILKKKFANILIKNSI